MIMDTWLHQGGFPLVKVAEGAEAGGRMRLTQVPFMYRAMPAESSVPSSAFGVGFEGAGRAECDRDELEDPGARQDFRGRRAGARTDRRRRPRDRAGRKGPGDRQRRRGRLLQGAVPETASVCSGGPTR